MDREEMKESRLKAIALLDKCKDRECWTNKKLKDVESVRLKVNFKNYV